MVMNNLNNEVIIKGFINSICTDNIKTNKFGQNFLCSISISRFSDHIDKIPMYLPVNEAPSVVYR